MFVIPLHTVLVDETARLIKLLSDIRQVRADLAVARREAREVIYTKLNSVGNMGAEQQGTTASGEGAGGGMIQIDFHGPHVKEMCDKFREQVKPVLPVVGKIMIITGRGLHSADGEGKLNLRAKNDKR